MHRALLPCVLIALSALPALAAEKLVLALDMDPDLISLAHHVDGFLFTPTLNFSRDLAGNLAERMQTPELRNHLIASARVRIDGAVAGYATEQEVIVTDPASGKLHAESAWLITLDHARARGFLAVKQRENAAETFGLIQQIAANPNGDWGDEPRRFLSTDGVTRVQLASGGLRPYQGGRFEEYNLVTPSDLKRYGRFRARIEFVIYPRE